MTSSSRPALGRGLSALIPKTGSGAGVDTVDIDLIAPNPQQPRLRFDPESLRELVESIREHGVLQPVIVTEAASDVGPKTYQLIAGERRLQAARAAGVTRMPVVVREAAGGALLELALVENLQREDLNPLEEAQAFRRLADEFGKTHDEIARRVGRSRVAVSNTIRLLSLEEDIRSSLASGQITEGHARALLGIDDSHVRLDAWRRIVADDLTVRQAEEIARALRATAPPGAAKRGRKAATPDPDARAAEDDLRTALSAAVTLRARKNGSGEIVIRFHNREELNSIIARVQGASSARTEV